MNCGTCWPRARAGGIIFTGAKFALLDEEEVHPLLSQPLEHRGDVGRGAPQPVRHEGRLDTNDRQSTSTATPSTRATR